MDYYCAISDRSINYKHRNKHNKTKRHYFMKNYVTNIYKYNDIVWGDVEKILHENIIIHIKKFTEFKIYVSCKINVAVEIKVYKSQSDLCLLLPTFNESFKSKNKKMGTLYVHIAGEMICNDIRENLSSKYDINCTPDMEIRSLTIKFVSRYRNMTFRHQLQQPRSMLETKMVKHIKYMSYEEQSDKYNFLTCKHKLCLI